jgi:hypothetical protein
MQKYEFNAVIRNGIIHIPKHLYKKRLSKVQVRVILLSENNSNNEIESHEKKFFRHENKN